MEWVLYLDQVDVHLAHISYYTWTGGALPMQNLDKSTGCQATAASQEGMGC